MHLIRFDAQSTRPIIHQGRRYFLLEGPPGHRALVDAACPHRGGPLDLGETIASVDGTPIALRCPWHHRCQTYKALVARALPTVISDGVVGTAVIAAGARGNDGAHRPPTVTTTSV